MFRYIQCNAQQEAGEKKNVYVGECQFKEKGYVEEDTDESGKDKLEEQQYIQICIWTK